MTDHSRTWLRQSVRLAVFIASNNETPFADETPDSWTLCVVGSSALDSHDEFLQVASWDGRVFRYYSRNEVLSDQAKSPNGRSHKGWIYQGVSTDAFTEDKSYLGPLHGHVNGALVMKELHKPWLHWSIDNHSFVSNLAISDKERFMDAPYLTDQTTRMLFCRVSSAESMEPIVQDGVSKWYNTRKQVDFFNDLRQLRPQPLNIRRWMAHVLLTTTTNVAVIQCYGKKRYEPADHFYDQEMLSQYSDTSFL
ncbi:hypothetical protein W97_07924, partial [Coniosporium apollinis CBS 100218]